MFHRAGKQFRLHFARVPPEPDLCSTGQRRSFACISCVFRRVLCTALATYLHFAHVFCQGAHLAIHLFENYFAFVGVGCQWGHCLITAPCFCPAFCTKLSCQARATKPVSLKFAVHFVCVVACAPAAPDNEPAAPDNDDFRLGVSPQAPREVSSTNPHQSVLATSC